MDPELTHALLFHLSKWRSGQQERPTFTLKVNNAIDYQEDIGWQNLLEGWLCLEWESIQQDYLKSIGSHRSVKRWVAALIKKLWTVLWDMWEHRNGILHNTQNIVTELREDLVDHSVKNIYHMATSTLCHTKDNYLITASLSKLLSRTMAYKETWLFTTQQAIKSQRALAAKDRRALHRMRTVLHTWLQRPR